MDVLIPALFTLIGVVITVLYGQWQWQHKYRRQLDKINEKISADLVHRRIEPYSKFMQQLEPMSTRHKQDLKANRAKAEQYAQVFQDAIYGEVGVLASWNTREYIIRARSRCLLYAEYQTSYDDLHNCIWAVHQALRSDLGVKQPNWLTEIDAGRQSRIARNGNEIAQNIKTAVHLLHDLYDEHPRSDWPLKYGRIVSAVIFDMDGLMLDTERIARDAWQSAARDAGCSMSNDDFETLLGLSEQKTEETLRKLWANNPNCLKDYAQIKKQQETYFQQYIAQDKQLKKPGLDALLDWLDKNRLFKAVGSSTRRDLLIQRLTIAGVIDRFDLIVSGDEVTNGKPAPDIFELAAKHLGFEPNFCLVLEGSENGIRAAHAAHTIPIWIPDSSTRTKNPKQEIMRLAYQRRTLSSLDEVREFLEANRGSNNRIKRYVYSILRRIQMNILRRIYFLRTFL